MTETDNRTREDARHETVARLFQPFTQRGLTLRNRIVVSPMCQYAARDGHVVDWHHQHHARMALGGVALGMVEATAVSPQGRITHGCTGLWADSHIEGLARIAAMYEEHGAVPAIQLAHAGRKASAMRPRQGARPLTADDAEGPWRAIAPSPVAINDEWPAPHEMTQADIDRVLGDFAAATGRARAAGFKLVEIHGAHGYLIHEFLSPVTNRRGDGFGGSAAARMRFALEVADAVRGAWPDDLPVWFRASVVDGAGIDVEHTIRLARELKLRGVDLIDCSSGGLSDNASLRRNYPGAGFQVPYAEAVREGAGIATMAVGFITQPEQAEAIVKTGQADLVAIGRELMADPNLGVPRRAGARPSRPLERAAGGLRLLSRKAGEARALKAAERRRPADSRGYGRERRHEHASQPSQRARQPAAHARQGDGRERAAGARLGGRGAAGLSRRDAARPDATPSEQFPIRQRFGYSSR